LRLRLPQQVPSGGMSGGMPSPYMPPQATAAAPHHLWALSSLGAGGEQAPSSLAASLALGAAAVGRGGVNGVGAPAGFGMGAVPQHPTQPLPHQPNPQQQGQQQQGQRQQDQRGLQQ
jgi:hypothetical protein